MFKKLTISLVASTLLFCSLNGVALAKGKPDIKIIVNNAEKKAEAKPEMKNGTVFVPVRAMFDALNIDYTFDGKTKKVSAQREGKSIELTLNNRDAVVNGKPYKLDRAVYTVNGYTFVPLRLIGETFGANISWDSKTQSVVIITDKNNNSHSISIPKDSDIKDFKSYQSLVDLSIKHPDYIADQLFYIIVEKKDISWLPNFASKVKQEDIQSALELALLQGNVEAADYIFTNFKEKISNSVHTHTGATLYLNTYEGNYWTRYIRIAPTATRKEYKLSNTAESSKQLVALLQKHGFKPNDIDLMRAFHNHTDVHVPIIETLVGLGLNPNAAVPESISISEDERDIKFNQIGTSNIEGVHTPIIVQAYHVTTWYPNDENIRKFATLVRHGGSVSLLTDKQKERIAYLTKDKPEFSDIYALVAQ